MEYLKRGPKVSPVVAALVIVVCTAVIVGIGYGMYGRQQGPIPIEELERRMGGAPSPSGQPAPTQMGGRVPPSSNRVSHPVALTQMVIKLRRLEEDSRKLSPDNRFQISPEQAKQILPLLRNLRGSQLSAQECEEKIAAVQRSLTRYQAFAVGQMGSSPVTLSDPARPFAQGAPRKELDRLIGLLSPKVSGTAAK